MPTQNPDPKQPPEPKTLEDPDTKQPSNGEFEKKKAEEDDDEEEEEEECGFCFFMKGGPCKKPFVEWENCIEQAESNKEDIVDKCSEATTALRKCMEANPDYYAPVLNAEKRAEEKARKALEQEEEEKEKKDSKDLEKKK